MIYFYFFLFVFISKEFFYFDEELLVVFSFFVVFSFLFKTLSSVIALELDTRSKLILDQFLTFLKLKKEILDLVFFYYKKRQNLLKIKVINLIKRLSYISYKIYFLKLIAFSKWYQRFILSKLLLIVFLENSYFKKEVLNLILNKENLNIEFFSEFLLLSDSEITKLITDSVSSDNFLVKDNL